jgi:hypothetical protein
VGETGRMWIPKADRAATTRSTARLADAGNPAHWIARSSRLRTHAQAISNRSRVTPRHGTPRGVYTLPAYTASLSVTWLCTAGDVADRRWRAEPQAQFGLRALMRKRSEFPPNESSPGPRV